MKSLLLGLLFLLSFGAGAQMTPDPTTWKYQVQKTGEDEYELIFRVTLAEGWHIFSQNPGDEFLVPPSFHFTDRDRDIRLLGRVQERGKLKTEKIEGLDNPVHYYEGTVDFVQKVKAKPGSKVHGEQEYQVCNDRHCLPPKTKAFQFSIE